MKKVILPAILFIPLLTLAQTSDLLLEAHTSKLKNAQKYTYDIALLMPEGKFDFKPAPEQMSFREQLAHIAENIYWLSSTYLLEKPVKPTKNSKNLEKEQLIKSVGDAYDYAIKSISSMDTSTLSKTFKWRNGQLTKIQFLNLIQDHQAHHVGQLIVYLRLAGIEPPKYIGW